MANKFTFGPAILVTAAFIGPGTVITASLAGANFGYALIWALLFSVVATIVLQEMAARLGVVTQKGLGENLRESIKQPVLKWLAIGLVFCAIVIGNGAYQGGNISGASLGLAGLFPDLGNSLGWNFWPLIIATVAFVLMWRGSYHVLEKSLLMLVAVMSLAFLVTFVITAPNLIELLGGMFYPRIPSGATLTVIALIGTTVVPYNLFLHAASAKQRWQSAENLSEARKDLYVSIPIGGLISIAIVSTAAAAFFGKQIELNSAADLAPALTPIFGGWAQSAMAIGLFAAGISSAITAPLAAAYALSGILGIRPDLTSLQFKIIWIVILIAGLLVATLNYRPVLIITFAQITNGLLLPIISLFLLWMMNQSSLGQHKNSPRQNALGGLIVLITIMLGSRSLLSAFGVI
ncbi:Nramp family divalent metal transporter [Aliikangiella marina]|uniref:Nramp family divalent metal transporter n=1 Tax=Aliikangiella marina TaxID=1712262 RepID=UPI001FE63A7B|nr:Nramp family divalent metal transporter [Aliikangiella marina]